MSASMCFTQALSIRTFTDGGVRAWSRRYVQFHQMQRREEMLPAEPKIEAFLSELAVKGRVAVSTQNQAFHGQQETTNIERSTSNIEH